MTAEEITKGSILLATLNKDNFPFGEDKDLIYDLHRMINKALTISGVSQQREMFLCNLEFICEVCDVDSNITNDEIADKWENRNK